MSNLIKKIFGKIAYWKRTISLYYYNSSSEQNIKLGSSFIYTEISQFSELEKYKVDFNKADYDSRFFQGHIFCGLEFENVLASYGWINPTGKHNIGELDLPMDLGNNIDSLYDFYTFEAYRGKGLYPYLLQKICTRNKKVKLIYVFPSNTSSVNGIKKAEFQFLGNLKGYNKHQYPSLVKKIWAK